MPTLEERVAYLEGKTEEYSRGFADLRDLIINLNSRVDALDQKVDRFREELSSRIDALDSKFSRYFLWTIGIQITVLLAVIGALLSK